MTLTLRKFSKRDIKPLFGWFPSERDVLLWAGADMPWPPDVRYLKRLITEHTGKAPNREVWAVDHEGDMIGHFQLRLNRRLRTVAIGRVAVSLGIRGKGFGKTLVHLIQTHAFSKDWVHRLELLVYDANQIAVKLYGDAGFVHEGTRRDTTPIGSEVWDTHMMSMLKHEFDMRTKTE